MTESATPMIDAIIAEVKESEALDLAGYPPEVITTAANEAFAVLMEGVEQAHAALFTLGLLMDDLTSRIVPPADADAAG